MPSPSTGAQHVELEHVRPPSEASNADSLNSEAELLPNTPVPPASRTSYVAGPFLPNSVPRTIAAPPSVDPEVFRSFFGATPREQAPSAEHPPSYDAPDCPAPAYEVIEEPVTMARYLFRFGFLFPPFWLLGAWIIFSDLQPIPEAECGRTREEQAQELAILRAAELRWARRCAYALLLMILVAAMVTLTVLLARVVKNHRS
ncbi:hypothetical protein BOTBODRAFT_125896 [Botryobasidium botryosum FD-172 SS1]|uniref:Uncharacterized protein n=1 Tax=Botryobasidium botryosum (strain FD-172 SS1) TaxID=930990 RepID=A0A067N060_BOTB1|nr:hypothetical protein BOTBODRAFT_125896 [Botryobasidium botryosum FD-172 SS1]